MVEFEFDFSETDGLLCLGSPEAILRQAAQLKKMHPALLRWEAEEFINHYHPGLGEAPRESMQTAADYVRTLAAALREAFPTRTFVIVNQIGGQRVTFYQPGDGAPDEDSLPTKPFRERIMCQSCRRPQNYRPRSLPDLEFPNAEWADCVECGRELFVRAGVERICLGPEAE